MKIKTATPISDFSTIHKSFSPELLTTHIREGYTQNAAFHSSLLKELRHVSRKHAGAHADINSLCTEILDQDVQSATKVLLSQNIKYSVRKGADISLDRLIQIAVVNDNPEVKSQIAYALGYKIKNSQEEQIDKQTIDKIKAITNENITRDAKNFLSTQIHRKFDVNSGSLSLIRAHHSKTIGHNTNEQHASVVTKSQQKTKVSCTNNKSEEKSIDILSLSDVLKARAKTIKTHVEKLPCSPRSIEGDDRAWYRNTYSEVKNLLKLDNQVFHYAVQNVSNCVKF